MGERVECRVSGGGAAPYKVLDAMRAAGMCVGYCGFSGGGGEPTVVTALVTLPDLVPVKPDPVGVGLANEVRDAFQRLGVDCGQVTVVDGQASFTVTAPAVQPSDDIDAPLGTPHEERSSRAAWRKVAGDHARACEVLREQTKELESRLASAVAMANEAWERGNRREESFVRATTENGKLRGELAESHRRINGLEAVLAAQRSAINTAADLDGKRKVELEVRHRRIVELEDELSRLKAQPSAGDRVRGLVKEIDLAKVADGLRWGSALAECVADLIPLIASELDKQDVVSVPAEDPRTPKKTRAISFTAKSIDEAQRLLKESAGADWVVLSLDQGMCSGGYHINAVLGTNSAKPVASKAGDVASAKAASVDFAKVAASAPPVRNSADRLWAAAYAQAVACGFDPSIDAVKRANGTVEATSGRESERENIARIIEAQLLTGWTEVAK